jgi:AcrR family transcriptional regulator
MVIRQRAVLPEDKQERHEAILDAAERLLLRSPERMANVAEVADEAGLAKGTVYLYFPSKEELLLALHERHVADFFGALIERLSTAQPIALEDMLSLTHACMVEAPTFLPLATRCFGIMATEVPPETAAAFKARMSARLTEAGAGLERHFPELEPGAGLALLRHSYALILGLWQMVASDPPAAGESCAMRRFEYPGELDRALRALWQGTIGRSLAGDAKAKD